MTQAQPTSLLAANVVHFARLLRRAGLPVGVGKTLSAVEAAAWVGPERRTDLHAALAATLLDRSDQRALFDEAFRLFWRARANPDTRLPEVGGPLARAQQRARPSNRLYDALREHDAPRHARERERITADAAITVSGREILRRKDFETMSTEELACAKRLLRELDLPLPARMSRRFRPHPKGVRLDLRAMLRHSLERGGEWIVPRHRSPSERPRDLVVLCDISGSMDRYARMLLHFLHALGGRQQHMHTFVFGTRLTHITRALRQRDVDQALAAVSRTVPDWSGGTRIGSCLREFNRRWSRRVLSRGGLVLLISDGLDAGEGSDLEAEMKRLRASCVSLLWLNPLLRFDGFEPRAAGIRTILPYVDHFLPAHNVASLADLGRALQSRPGAGSLPFRRTMEATRWK
jgi:uncharacterized protein with von Willebrand factor type A (vWA) domain